MSPSTTYSDSFTLSRWLHCPPESSEEKGLAAKAMEDLAFRLLESLEQHCKEEIRRRRIEPPRVQKVPRARQRPQHWLQRRQNQQQHQYGQDQVQVTEQQEQQEQQGRENQQQWEATQTLCGPLAHILDDLDPSPNHQVLNTMSTTVTAPAPTMPNFGLHEELILPQTGGTSPPASSTISLTSRPSPSDKFEVDTNNPAKADAIEEDSCSYEQG